VVFQIVNRMGCFPVAHSSIIFTKVENGLPERQGFLTLFTDNKTGTVPYRIRNELFCDARMRPWDS